MQQVPKWVPKILWHSTKCSRHGRHRRVKCSKFQTEFPKYYDTIQNVVAMATGRPWFVHTYFTNFTCLLIFYSSRPGFSILWDIYNFKSQCSWLSELLMWGALLWLSRLLLIVTRQWPGGRPSTVASEPAPWQPSCSTCRAACLVSWREICLTSN